MRWLLCLAFGHDWFPPPQAREYLPVLSVCLRCPAQELTLPYGNCLGGHPLVEHYDLDGREHPLPVDVCKTRWPR